MISISGSAPLIGGGSVLELGYERRELSASGSDDDVGIVDVENTELTGDNESEFAHENLGVVGGVGAARFLGAAQPRREAEQSRSEAPAVKGPDKAPYSAKHYESKAYDISFIKAGANYANISRALDIVRDFIVAKNRIIYGGMSIDISLRAAGEAGIYPPDEVPDYDFMSPDFYADSIELAGILHAAGFAEVNSINGTHVSTRRVRLGSDSVADITYTPPAIFAAMPTVTHDGFRVVHPDFQRMDMHRALSLLLEKPPREVIQQRAAKDYKRYQLLDGAYPIAAPHFSAEPLGNTPGVSSAPKKPDGPMAVRKFQLPSGEDFVVGGFAAMAALLGFTVGRTGDELAVAAPAAWGDFPLCLYTDRPYAAAAELGLKSPKYFSRYLDSYHPRAICGDRCEIYDNLGTLIPTWKYSDVRMCTVHLVALYMLLRSFAPPILGHAAPAEAAERSARFRGYYAVLADRLRACNLGSDPVPDGYAISLDMYGSQNWPLEYLQTMAVNSEHVARAPDYSGIDRGSGENEPLNRPTVKLGWYPDRGTPPEIIAAHSELFLMTDGAERPAFRAILPLDK